MNKILHTNKTETILINLFKKNLLLLVFILFSLTTIAQRQMEDLDRGVLPIRISSNTVLVSWRILGTEFTNASYNVYRGSTKLNSTPITGASNFADNTAFFPGSYSVAAVIDGEEQSLSVPVEPWDKIYKKIPISAPTGGTTPDNVTYTYDANDASVGDLDGDGQYEIILKWYPTNAKDNAHSGYTGNTILQGLEMDGTVLWTINLGKNIRSGSHYTQFMVYDLNGDGKAELVCKTADGSTDSEGTILGNENADYRNSNGYVLSGPEYLSVFSGETGAFINTVDYIPARGSVSSWGDNYGNRVDRFLACVAYLDGVHPSVVFCRGYYTRTVLAAWDFDGTNLQNKWVFDSNTAGSQYEEQGNHSVTVGDVDQDGKDEIIYGSLTVDDDGTPFNSTGYKHGDASHLGDFNPNSPGLEYFTCHESAGYSRNTPLGNFGAFHTNVIPKTDFRGNQLGEIFWQVNQNSGTADIGRCLIADIDPNYPGAEAWASDGTGIHDVNGNVISTTYPTTAGNGASYNMAAWYDGDLSRELVDRTVITEWNGSGTSRVLTAYNYDGLELASNNSSKSNPCLIADIIGDWREEIIWRASNNTYLVIMSSKDMPTERIFTLMHDPVYRTSIAWQNVAYNQPAHTGFFLGTDMPVPAAPNIYLANETLSVDAKEINSSKIKLYPNPTSGKVYISGANNGTINVYNSIGKLLLQKQANNIKSVDLKGYTTGLYFIKIKDETGIHAFKIFLK
ncbi:T9SS type A sorting domain-containing protein [Thalassobellus sediminis]|uniref:rhamnogalacturonan lyase family protein n=1 Tax=Thalassobellus sediminis TaxID=3367753 RepID=UPI0037A9CD8B